MGVKKIGAFAPIFFTTIEQPFEQLVACSTDEDSATRGAIAKGNKRLVNGMALKGTKTIFHKKMEPQGSIFYYSFRANRRAIGHAKCRKVTPRRLRLSKTKTMDSMGWPQRGQTF